MPIIVPAYIDEFLNQYVMDHKWYADEETYERALNDSTGPYGYLPFMYDRAFPDPEDQNRILIAFSYGSASLKFERDAPARAEECLSALTQVHPDFADLPRVVLLSGA